MKLEQEIRAILNKHSRENKSNTPDHILAWFLMDCLRAWEYATNWREEYYGRKTAHPIRSQFQFDETSKMTMEEMERRGIDKPPVMPNKRYLTTDRMPDNHIPVQVDGGIAYYNGRYWVSSETARVITWPVEWWEEIAPCR